GPTQRAAQCEQRGREPAGGDFEWDWCAEGRPGQYAATSERDAQVGGERERAGQWERVHLSEPGSRESTGGACIRARSAGGRHGEDYTTAQWSAESGGGGRKCGSQCSRE